MKASEGNSIMESQTTHPARNTGETHPHEKSLRVGAGRKMHIRVPENE